MLVEAEFRGRPSHGLQRLPRLVERIANGVADPSTSGERQWRGAALLSVDGKRGLGPVVAFATLDALSERAAITGCAVGVIRNSNHIGMLALYAERIARKGQVLIALTTSEALMHPFGGREARIGTNPIAIGVPSLDQPFVLDMATSLVSMGQVHDHAERGVPLEPGWAVDADGNATLDAAAARSGAIAPFGGAKGYALGLAFEVLVGSLTAAALGTDVKGTLDSTEPCNKGDVFIVVQPASASMADAIAAYLAQVRDCPPTRPDVPVAVPGDRAQRQRIENLANGVEVPQAVWDRIVSLAGNQFTADTESSS